MRDSEIEELLRRYRPVGPPARLRGRVGAAVPPRRAWPWAAAAAVLLASVLTFHAAAARELTGASLGVGPGMESEVTDDLAERFGGDSAARELAALVVIEQRMRMEHDAVAPIGPSPAPESGDER